MKKKILPSSFRDPRGFVYQERGQIYRQINKAHLKDFDYFIKIGLYDLLVKEKLLISHKEITASSKLYRIIKPKKIPFISYPYEWSFSQLKDAALTTLKIQKIALNYKMSLRDCSAYNIQFLNGKPILIDTLSFEKRVKNTPWAAYKQFCEHFLAPLALIAYKDFRLGQMQKNYIDGIPIDLAASLLPFSSFFKIPILLNIHLHSFSQKKQTVDFQFKKEKQSHCF